VRKGSEGGIKECLGRVGAQLMAAGIYVGLQNSGEGKGSSKAAVGLSSEHWVVAFHRQ
jgi:hypothetical protein